MASPVVVGATIIAALYFGREIFIPIAIALLLSFVLTPLVNRLRRLRLPRLVAVGVSVGLTLGIVAALATLIGIQAADLAGDVPRYRATIERKINGLRDSPVGHATEYVANIGRALHGGAKEVNNPEGQPPAPPTPPPTPPGPEQPQAAPKPVLVEVAASPPGPIEMLSTVLSPVMHPLATVGIVFVVLLFVLMQREDLRDRMIRLAGSSDLHRTTVAIDDAAKRLSRYFVVQLALNAAFGIVIGIGLYVIGVPNPVLWAIFAALMRFVPYLGAVLSALLPMALAAAVDPGWNMMIAVAILFVVLEPLTGQVFEPIVYGQSTGLSPFAVLVSALFWTWLWGPVGLLLSTPLTVCLVVLGRYVERLEFLDVLFGDRPALTPVQNFYQRVLAGDAEEVLGHAELILQQCSLSSYYDDVVLKALELAAQDAARGADRPAEGGDARGPRRADRRPLRPERRRRGRVRRRGGGRLQRAADGSDPRGALRGLDPRGRGPVRRGPRLPGRGRGCDPRTDPGEARPRRPHDPLRRDGFRADRAIRSGDGAHGLRGLPRPRRRADPSAPADPPAEGSVARGADPARPVARPG